MMCMSCCISVSTCSWHLASCQLAAVQSTWRHVIPLQYLHRQHLLRCRGMLGMRCRQYTQTTDLWLTVWEA